MTGRIVFLAEDDYFQAKELRRACEESGFEVIGPAGRLEEALALVREAPRIDGAVLDINLHDVMIYPVADLLRERGVPFVFATGYERTTLPARFADVPHHEKPVGRETIMAALFG